MKLKMMTLNECLDLVCKITPKRGKPQIILRGILPHKELVIGDIEIVYTGQLPKQ